MVEILIDGPSLAVHGGQESTGQALDMDLMPGLNLLIASGPSRSARACCRGVASERTRRRIRERAVAEAWISTISSNQPEEEAARYRKDCDRGHC